MTYSGSSSTQNIAHNLGSVPGCIIVKRTSGVEDWFVYHTSLGNTKYLKLNTTGAEASGFAAWNNTSPTSTQFTVLGGRTEVNAAGSDYVAYLFAHNAGGFGLTGTDNVISCGSFTTNASGIATVTLGYEPQWVLIKRTDSTSEWHMLDNMRGFSQTIDAWLRANSSAAENSTYKIATPTATGKIMSQSETRTKIKPSEQLKEPPMYKVIYLNDNQTTMEFVIETLIEFFNYTTDTAFTITEDIHNAGSACVAVLPYEIAEQKGIEVTLAARSNSYPLQIKLEPDQA